MSEPALALTSQVPGLEKTSPKSHWKVSRVAEVGVEDL